MCSSDLVGREKCCVLENENVASKQVHGLYKLSSTSSLITMNALPATQANKKGHYLLKFSLR